MANTSITITVELSESQALAFAQFLKRVGFDDYRALSSDQEEAYAMRDGGEGVRQSLADSGCAPR